MGQLLGTTYNPYIPSGIEIYLEQLRIKAQQHLVFRLESYVEQDPDKKLRNCHPRNYPECNCQMLSQRLIFKGSPDKLVNIAEEFAISYKTLHSHWVRKAIPLLQEILIELGYRPNHSRL